MIIQPVGSAHPLRDRPTILLCVAHAKVADSLGVSLTRISDSRATQAQRIRSIMSVVNDGRTKEDWYNSDKILSTWGFTDSKCHCCGIDNSSLEGLLMQVCLQCWSSYDVSFVAYQECGL